jgi:hypothetical protein
VNYFFAFLFVTSSVFAEMSHAKEVKIPQMDVDEHYDNPLKEDELDVLAKLIHVNQGRLIKQKEMMELMALFQKQKQEFIEGNQSQKHSFAMVTNARHILTEIKEESLAYLFSTEYLEELVFFSSLAAKSMPLRPEMSSK